MRTIIEDLRERNLIPGQMQIVISILQVYNCRASEVLSAQWKNFDKDKFLILDSSKQSANVIVRDRMILNEIDLLPRIHRTHIFYQINYQKLYDHCKKRYSHLFVRFKGKKNFKVTHGFRYAAVESINDELYVRDVLFHRSVKSGRYYQPKLKGVSNDKKKNANNV